MRTLTKIILFLFLTLFFVPVYANTNLYHKHVLLIGLDGCRRDALNQVYNEIKKAYPDCKFILTLRDTDRWYESVKYHYEISVPKDKAALEEAIALQKYVYGSETPTEFLYKKKILLKH